MKRPRRPGCKSAVSMGIPISPLIMRYIIINLVLVLLSDRGSSFRYCNMLVILDR